MLSRADYEVGRFLKPMAKDDFLRDMEISRQQAAEGKCQEMGQALAEISEKYGL